MSDPKDRSPFDYTRTDPVYSPRRLLQDQFPREYREDGSDQKLWPLLVGKLKNDYANEPHKLAYVERFVLLTRDPLSVRFDRVPWDEKPSEWDTADEFIGAMIEPYTGEIPRVNERSQSNPDSHYDPNDAIKQGTAVLGDEDPRVKWLTEFVAYLWVAKGPPS